MKPNKELLEKYNAFHKSDSDFSATARLQQSMWRKSKNYPPGKLGNYLELSFAKETKNNFLTEKIKTLVQYEIYASRKEKKLISEPRIWENLLSSQSLCFNLFGELHFDLQLATKFFKKIYPKIVNEITEIKFEYSPGRRDKNFTGDRSAFDAFVEYTSVNGEKGFIGIEVKYAESLKDDTEKVAAIFEKHELDYLPLHNESRQFTENSVEKLKENPLQQIWRDHLLAIATMKNYEEGFFVFLYPRENTECESAVNEYQKYLNKEISFCRFVSENMEKYINTLAEATNEEWVHELKNRYIIK